MGAPATLNMTVVERDTLQRSFVLRDKATKAPIDLTGATIDFYAVQKPEDVTVWTAGLTTGVTCGTPTNGEFFLSKDVDLDKGKYDLISRIVFPGGVRKTQTLGILTVLEGEPEDV